MFNLPIMPTEAMVFVDAGAAWSSGQSVDWRFERDTIRRVPVVSTGIAARSIIFGALPLEFYYAFPYQRPRENAVFGLRIGIGW
jgi:outer membrane protein assembly factor BamA